MPRTISLAAYAVKVWDPEEKDCEPISGFDGQYDLLDFFQDTLDTLSRKFSRNEGEKQVVRVSKLKKSGRVLTGILETGEYGIESTLIDVDDGHEVHKRKTTDANMLPFYFMIDLPQGVDEGIVLLQRTGMYGIRHLTYGILDTLFDAKYPEYRLRLHPIIDQKEMEKYQKGKVETLRFISFTIPSDIADAFEGGHKETFGHAELVIHARRGKYLPLGNRLAQFFAGKREISQLIALRETKFKYEDVKVRARVGRTARTVDLRDLKKIRAYYDISDSVEFDKTGHPKYSSIDGIAGELRDQLAKSLY